MTRRYVAASQDELSQIADDAGGALPDPPPLQLAMARRERRAKSRAAPR